MPEWLSVIFRYKEKKSPDTLGKFPINIHTRAFPERRYLWTSRCLVICAAISCSLTIMLTLTIFLLLPQRGALPLLLEKGGTRQILKESRPVEASISAQELLEENLMRNYVIARHHFVPSFRNTTIKWTEGSEFQKLSSPEEYRHFIQAMSFNTVKKLVKSGLSRKVMIKQAKKLNNHLWMIQFTTVSSTLKSPEPLSEHWKAYIHFVYNTVNTGISYENPLNLMITAYNLSYLGKDEDPISYLQKAKDNSAAKDKN